MRPSISKVRKGVQICRMGLGSDGGRAEDGKSYKSEYPGYPRQFQHVQHAQSP
jgi:hypothetical protein